MRERRVLSWWLCCGGVQLVLFGTWASLSLLACPALHWGCSLICILLITVLIVSKSSKWVFLVVDFSPPVLSTLPILLVGCPFTRSFSSTQLSFSGLVFSCVGLSVPVLLGPFWPTFIFLPPWSALCWLWAVSGGVAWCCLQRCMLYCSYVGEGGARSVDAWVAACST